VKQQFQINLVSCSDPIDVLLVNQDSDVDRPTVTCVPPRKTESSSPAQEVPTSTVQTSVVDSGVTMPTTPAAAAAAVVNKDSEMSAS